MPVIVDLTEFDASRPRNICGHAEKAASYIQKRAPGPPLAIAPAKPSMFPVPMVAESAVHSAPNEVTSPWPPSRF
jgi:hypothetical protein